MNSVDMGIEFGLKRSRCADNLFEAVKKVEWRSRGCNLADRSMLGWLGRKKKSGNEWESVGKIAALGERKWNQTEPQNRKRERKQTF